MTAVLIMATLLAARMYWPTSKTTSEAFVYAAVVGVNLGLFTWVLNYWQLTTLQGGLLLLALFYVTAGLVQQYLYGRFNRRVILEYGTAGIVLAFVALVALN